MRPRVIIISVIANLVDWEFSKLCNCAFCSFFLNYQSHNTHVRACSYIRTKYIRTYTNWQSLSLFSSINKRSSPKGIFHEICINVRHRYVSNDITLYVWHHSVERVSNIWKFSPRRRATAAVVAIAVAAAVAVGVAIAIDAALSRSAIRYRA